jgi:GTP-binding protein
MLPVVALVGRPNVGKSTLYNALTRSRDALVADLPGVTRDRHYGICRLGERPFMVVDTGGLTDREDGIDALTAQQVRVAIDEASVVVLMVDARDGLLPQDRNILDELRRSGKPLVLAVNKTDGLDEETALAEFARFGLGTLVAL